MRSGVVRNVVLTAGAAMALSLLPACAATESSDAPADLSGRWGGGGGGGTVTAINDQGELVEYANFAEIGNDNVRVLARLVTYRKGNPTFGERDAGMYQRLFSNPPLYKPEYWDQVQFLDMHGNYEDSAFHCMPTGVPRMGPPVKIMQTADEMIFMYNAGNVFRVIPIDGRPHDPVASLDQTFMGDSIGRWDGDTLVVDVVGFNQETWIGWPGWFHTADMRVEERFRREGDTLHYQATVYDPEILVEPFVMDPLIRELNTSGGAYIEQPPCVTTTHTMVGRERG